MKDEKAEKLFRGITGVGEDLIEEAEMMQKRKKTTAWRWALVAACLSVALLGTAAAANVIARQSRTHLINEKDELWNVVESAMADKEDDDVPAAVAVGGGYDGAYEYKTSADDLENWWNAYGDTPLEEVEGTEEDGWTKMRTFQREGTLEHRYLGETISDFNSLWDGTPIDASWLEEHYTPVPDTQTAYMKFISGQEEHFSYSGAFRGQDDAAFTVQVSQWDRPFADTTFQMTEGYDHVELYQTSDGVEVLIKIGTSNSGKSVFWASFTAGCNSFSLHGTEMQLEGIRAVLDSLSLSNLLEYTAAE